MVMIIVIISSLKDTLVHILVTIDGVLYNLYSTVEPLRNGQPLSTRDCLHILKVY